MFRLIKRSTGTAVPQPLNGDFRQNPDLTSGQRNFAALHASNLQRSGAAQEGRTLLSY
jgi:hypothetical protein